MSVDLEEVRTVLYGNYPLLKFFFANAEGYHDEISIQCTDDDDKVSLEPWALQPKPLTLNPKVSLEPWALQPKP